MTDLQLARRFAVRYRAASHELRIAMVRQLEPCEADLLMMLSAFLFGKEEIAEQQDERARLVAERTKAANPQDPRRSYSRSYRDPVSRPVNHGAQRGRSAAQRRPAAVLGPARESAEQTGSIP